jgi:transposase-like protein
LNEEVVAEKKRSSPSGAAGGKKTRPRYAPEVRLKAVRLRLEEGFSLKDARAKVGVRSRFFFRPLWMMGYTAPFQIL